MKFDLRLWQAAKTVRFFLILTIALGFLLGLLIIVQARTLSHIVDQVFLKGATLDGVRPALLLLLLVIMGRAGLAWASEVSAFRVAARVKADLRKRVFDHLMRLGPAYIRGERTGELTSTVTEGIEQLEAYFSQYLPQLVLAALIPLTVLVVVLPLDVLSGMVLLITAPLIPFFMILIGRAAEALTRRQYTALSFMSAHFLDVLQGLTTLKLFNRSRAQIETIARVSNQFRDTTLSVLRVAFLSAFALEMIATISTAIVAVEIGLRLLYGSIEFEQAFFILVLAPDFYLPLRLLGTRFHAGMSGVAAAGRIFEILETKGGQGARSRGQGARGRDQWAVDSKQWSVDSKQWAVIRFEDVHFAYDEGRRSALKGASFEIKAGQRVALIGATGAGKSTVANLLLCFIRPQRGAIMLDDVSLDHIAPGAWRAQVAWVPQLPYLFNETIAANILKARAGASFDEVIQAAQLAHADEFIRELPHGYDTVMGERGVRLSGGQAQRIALARAFLKDAPLLIMDEPTSNLDVENEALIQDSIDRLLEKRTVLIITHRLHTAIRADQIVVLEAGRVVEAGAPETLAAGQGVFRRLVTA